MARTNPITKPCPHCGLTFTKYRLWRFCTRRCSRQFYFASRPATTRFLKFIVPGSPDECWEYQGSRDIYGYGRWGRGGAGSSVKAHRLYWEICNGPIPEGMFVCHRCDNPPCVNPRHLFLGTTDENNRDRAAKGRNRDQRGERHNMAKLSESDVISIRNIEGEAHSKIGAKFGVSQTLVSAIKRRERWAHVPEVTA